MIITEKLDNRYKNQIENIKNEKNRNGILFTIVSTHSIIMFLNEIIINIDKH